MYKTRTSYRTKWETLVDQDVRKIFEDNVSSLFREFPECTPDAEVASV